MRTDVSIVSVGTGASVTPEKYTPRNKRSMKPTAMLPPRKDPIPNQDINILITKKYQILSPHLAKFPPGFKSLINDANDPNSTEDDRNDSTDTSRNERKYSVNNLEVTNNKDIDDKYKYDNSKVLIINEKVINKTE